jgi:hypothetical protein
MVEMAVARSLKRIAPIIILLICINLPAPLSKVPENLKIVFGLKLAESFQGPTL